MLCSCTCNILKRWTWLNILDLNWVSSWWEQGGPFQKTYRKGVVNVRWVSTPYLYPYTGEFVIFFTPHQILSMFSSGSSFPRNGNLWLGRTIVFYIMLKILTGEISFGDLVDWSTPWHVKSNPKKPVIFPVNSLAVYIFLYPQHFMGDKKLFPSSYQYNRCTKVIIDIIK